jgi:hypothetical protein
MIRKVDGVIVFIGSIGRKQITYMVLWFVVVGHQQFGSTLSGCPNRIIDKLWFFFATWRLCVEK